jgi:hypothetical protein
MSSWMWIYIGMFDLMLLPGWYWMKRHHYEDTVVRLSIAIIIAVFWPITVPWLVWEMIRGRS